MMYLDDIAGVSAGKDRADDDLDAALELLELMGLPVSAAKVFRPARRGETLGGEINLDTNVVVLSETFMWKLGVRTDEMLANRREDRSLRALETLVHMHAHVSLFYPKLKPEVNASMGFYYRQKNYGMRGFDLDDDFRHLCTTFRAVTTNVRGLPLLLALQFPARGFPQRIDVESDASGNLGWGIVILPPPGTDRFVLYAYDRWTPREQKAHINTKELYVTLLTAFVFGDSHPGHWVMEAIDNTVAKANAENNKAKTPEMRRILQLRAEKYLEIGWKTAQQHITSKANDLADALSRDDHAGFVANAAKRGIEKSRLRRFELAHALRLSLETLLTDETNN